MHLPLLLLTTLLAQSPQDLAQKAASAVEHNDHNETHWNWTVLEERRIEDSHAKTLQDFPSVTIESVIRQNGARCNVVAGWGDGMPPLLAHATADQRCESTGDFRMYFNLAELLKGQNIRARDLTLEIHPDRERMKSGDYAVRCAASVEATVTLDPATFFPHHLSGKAAENGCFEFTDKSGNEFHSPFAKDSAFEIDYQLQPDKFNHPDRVFWIRTREHWAMPRDFEYIRYWGRAMKARVKNKPGQRWVKDVRTTAQEFGAESKVIQEK
jgi:hypothetical protein